MSTTKPPLTHTVCEGKKAASCNDNNNKHNNSSSSINNTTTHGTNNNMTLADGRARSGARALHASRSPDVRFVRIERGVCHPLVISSGLPIAPVLRLLRVPKEVWGLLRKFFSSYPVGIVLIGMNPQGHCAGASCHNLLCHDSSYHCLSDAPSLPRTFDIQPFRL